jgi:hypothetical protein
MARLPKAAIAVTLLAFVLALLAPAVAMAAAAAADAAPWVGTYKGVGVGKDAKGKKGTSGVTIWVEDLGGSSRFTFRFDKFPVVVSRTAPNGGGLQGSQLMRISVNEQGVSGSGLIVVYPRNGNYLMAGKGAGKALGKQGAGRMGAVRTSTGVELPSFADQVSDLFGALISRKVPSSGGGSSDAGPGGGGAPQALAAVEMGPVRVAAAGDEAAGEAAGAQDDPDVVVKQAPEVVFVKAVVVEPASTLDLAKAKPPVTTQAAFTVTVLLVVLTVVAAVISVGPKARRTAAAGVPAAGPDAPGEGS